MSNLTEITKNNFFSLFTIVLDPICVTNAAPRFQGRWRVSQTGKDLPKITVICTQELNSGSVGLVLGIDELDANGIASVPPPLPQRYCTLVYHRMAQYSSQAEVVDDVQHAGAVDSDTDEKTIDDPPFPEGGWQAWRTIAGAYVDHARVDIDTLTCDSRFLVQFATFG